MEVLFNSSFVTTRPSLRTKRLTLELPRSQDLATIVELANHPRISQMTLNIPYPYAEKDAIFWLNMAEQGFLKQDTYIFGIRLANEDKFVGGMGLHLNLPHHHAELGYWIGAPYWNQGVATEAAAAVLRYGFETLGLYRIYARHLATNPASGRIMAKNGMKVEGTLVGHYFKDGSYVDAVLYGLTREQWQHR